MSDGVKTRHDIRRTDTEERIVRAAQELFVRDGWAATTLAAVAEAAGVAARTVYVRFGTKAELLKRAVDVAVVGDVQLVDLAGREHFRAALTAPTADARLVAFADGARDVVDRMADILEVARQAEPTEPLIAAAAQAGRAATRDQVSAVWRGLAADGLLPDGVDVEWAAATTGLLAHAETYLLVRRTLGWDPQTYRDWVLQTWRHCAGLPPSGRAANMARTTSAAGL